MVLFGLAYLGAFSPSSAPASCRFCRLRFRVPASRSCAPACRSWLAWRRPLPASQRSPPLAAAGLWRRTSLRGLAALGLFALFALTLLSETLAEHLNRPLVALGRRLSQTAPGAGGPAGALGLGHPGRSDPAIGALRPANLGLILTGAALNGASAATSLCCLPTLSAPPPRWRWRCLWAHASARF